MNATEINEIIGLLAYANPESLERLRQQFPQHIDTLEPGITLGTEINATNANADEALVRGLACQAGLQTVIFKCDELIPTLKRKLKTLGNLQLSSQIIIGVSGASVVSQIGVTAPAFMLLTGYLSLIGSLTTLFVQYKSGLVNNNQQSLFNLYDKLVDYRLDAEQQLFEVNIAIQVLKENNFERLFSVLAKANQTCLDIRKILEKI